MNPKSLILLEFPKVLARLKSYASFSASEALAEALRPTSSLENANLRQQETREARLLISINDSISFQGAVDLEPLTDQTLHGMTLEASDLLAVRNTLILSRTARRVLLDNAETAPILAAMAEGLSDGGGLIDLINRTISERGEVLDSASPELAHIRSEIKVVHARLMDRLNRYLTDPASSRMLQETLITQRSGRYVLPLRAEHKGQIKAIIHDQSASGATLFVEPIAVVELNNKFRELELAERDEVLRVLRVLSQQIALQAEGLNLTTKAMAGIDLALMKAHYADDLHANEPELVPFPAQPPEDHPGSIIQLRRARHPLLDPQKVVPIDFELDRQTFSVVLTGPNTGGKTVSLKTAGLLALMAQAGLHIPAQSGSETCVFRDIYADIGDEQSIEQSLSTFSAHVTNIVRILKRAHASTLIILDELGAGTDPQEGSALARAILTHLLNRKAPCLIATHYPELKAFAHSTEGALNASVEFDLKSLRPTYRLITGLPGRSNALEIAKRLGLDEEIVNVARGMVNPDDLRAEDLLDEIHRQLEAARKERAEAENQRIAIENERQALEEKLSAIDEERVRVLEEAREQARQDLEELLGRIEDMRRQTQAPVETVRQKKELRKQAEELQTAITETIRPEPAEPTRRRPLKAGDRVYVRSLKTDGTVTAIEGDQIEVQIGKMRLKTDLPNIQRSKDAALPKLRESEPAPAEKSIFHPSPGMELHLRGMRAEDALLRLERYLDDAYSAGLPFVRIVHGKGTGTLRQLVRQALSESPLVSRWENALDNEGGDGVTIARL